MPGTLLRSTPINSSGVWNVTYAAPNFEALTGYPAPFALRTGWLTQQIAPADMAAVLSRQESALGGADASTMFRFKHANGSQRCFLARMRGIKHCDGSHEVIALWSDVTHEQQNQAMLAQAAKMAQLGELATGIAHELNQPLAMISAATENALRLLTLQPDATERVVGKLNAIIEMTTRAADLIDHMRIFGRANAGELVPVALADATQSVLGLLRSKLRQHHVQVVLDLPPDLPMILSKQTPLEQVLINLISNSCDAHGQRTDSTTRAARDICVSAAEIDQKMVIAVSDNAGGIPEQYLSKIFEPFFTTKPAGMGTGLGLSISYGIISDLGGTIAVTNQNDGARFTITLPLTA